MKKNQGSLLMLVSTLVVSVSAIGSALATEIAPSLSVSFNQIMSTVHKGRQAMSVAHENGTLALIQKTDEQAQALKTAMETTYKEILPMIPTLSSKYGVWDDHMDIVLSKLQGLAAIENILRSNLLLLNQITINNHDQSLVEPTQHLLADVIAIDNQRALFARMIDAAPMAIGVDDGRGVEQSVRLRLQEAANTISETPGDVDHIAEELLNHVWWDPCSLYGLRCTGRGGRDDRPGNI